MDRTVGVNMDAVDAKQQEELEALKRRDATHDADLKWLTAWVKFGMKFVGFVLVLWVIISSTVIFVLLDKLDKLALR